MIWLAFHRLYGSKISINCSFNAVNNKKTEPEGMHFFVKFTNHFMKLKATKTRKSKSGHFYRESKRY